MPGQCQRTASPGLVSVEVEIQIERDMADDDLVRSGKTVDVGWQGASGGRRGHLAGSQRKKKAERRSHGAVVAERSDTSKARAGGRMGCLRPAACFLG